MYANSNLDTRIAADMTGTRGTELELSGAARNGKGRSTGEQVACRFHCCAMCHAAL